MSADQLNLIPPSAKRHPIEPVRCAHVNLDDTRTPVHWASWHRHELLCRRCYDAIEDAAVCARCGTVKGLNWHTCRYGTDRKRRMLGIHVMWPLCYDCIRKHGCDLPVAK